MRTVTLTSGTVIVFVSQSWAHIIDCQTGGIREKCTAYEAIMLCRTSDDVSKCFTALRMFKGVGKKTAESILEEAGWVPGFVRKD